MCSYTNTSNGLEATLTDGDAEFIKKLIASGTLGCAEASTVSSWRGHQEDPWYVFLSITQNQIDASSFTALLTRSETIREHFIPDL